MPKPLDSAQLLAGLHTAARITLLEPLKIRDLSLLKLTVVQAEAGDASDPVERALALRRIIESIVEEEIATTPHPDDEPFRRVQVAEMLLYPPGRHAKSKLGVRRQYSRQHLARGPRVYHRAHYELHLLEDIAHALYDRERASRAAQSGPITLDVGIAVRHDASANYLRELRVKPMDIVEISTVLRLREPPGAPDALELSLTIDLGRSGTHIGCRAQAWALNARHLPGYRSFDSINLTSEVDEARIALRNPRAFYVQTVQSTDADSFAWDAGRALPDSWIQIWPWSDEAWTIKLRPTVDRTLTTAYRDALKFSFLTDIAEATETRRET